MNMTSQSPGNLAPEFRGAMRRVAATVTLITTTDAAGQRHGMVATAVSSVTMDPPTLLICVNRSASLYAPLIQHGQFCVNVLMASHHELVACFSGQKIGETRFDTGDWRLDGTTGLPYLHGAQCNLFCRVDRVTTVGTHSVIIAGVNAVQVSDDVVPLLYVDGGLRALGATVC